MSDWRGASPTSNYISQLKRSIALITGLTLGLGACAPAEGSTHRDATSEVVVRVLDVGQGDATLIENGRSRVLIDGGPEPSRMGRLLDSLGLNNSTIDVVVLTHQHADHLMG